MSGDDGDDYSIASLLADKKKQKKWRKKVDKGDANHQLAYLISKYCCGLDGVPSVEYTVDRSRYNAGHDIQISELRELLSCVLLDHPSSVKGFKLANKSFMRFVLLVHVEGLADGRTFLHRLKLGDVFRLRVSQEREHMSYLPYKLLTLSSSDESAVAALTKHSDSADDLGATTELAGVYRRMQTYVLSSGQRRLWNYPQLQSQPHTQSAPQSCSAPCGEPEVAESGKRPPALARETSDAKRVRTDDTDDAPQSEFATTELSGSGNDPTLPSLDDAMAIMRATAAIGPLSVSYFSDFPANHQLVTEHDYVQSLPRNSDAFAALFPVGQIVEPLQIAAVDCEMCDTTVGNEVVRVTVLSMLSEEDMTRSDLQLYKGHRVVLDCFVQPRGVVLDYRTAFSGVDADTLADVTTTLPQVQLALLRLFSMETILVGHSIDSDLRSLHLHHRTCIDTAILFPHAKGFPLRRKLRHLAHDCLNIAIQNSKAPTAGHDSREDAHAALLLVLAKLEKGDKIGAKFAARRSVLRQYSDRKVQSLLVASGEEVLPVGKPVKMDDETAAAGLAGADDGAESVSTSVKAGGESKANGAAAQRSSGQDFHYGLEDVVDGETQLLRTASVDTADAVVDFLKAKASATSVEEGLKSLSALSSYAQEVDPAALVCVSVPCTAGHDESAVTRDILALCQALKERVGRHGMVVITTQNSSKEAQELFQRKRASQHAMSALTWSGDREKQLKAAVASVNTGFVAFAIV